MKVSSLTSAFSGLSTLAFPDFFALVERDCEFLTLREKSRRPLRVGGNIDAYDERGYTPLHCAVELQSKFLISYLLNDYHADVNAKTQNEGCTPLILAVKLKNEPLILNLLNIPDLDVNEVSRDGRSALHFACQVGSFNIVELLLNHGALADLCMHSTMMKPVHFAIQHRQLEILKLFDRRDIPLNGLYYRMMAEAPVAETCWHLLARSCSSCSIHVKIQMAALLVKSYLANEAEAVQESALKVAIDVGNQAIVAALLVFGATWDEPGLPENHLISAFKSRFPDKNAVKPSLLPEVWDLAIKLDCLELVLSLKVLNRFIDSVKEDNLIAAMSQGAKDEVICELIPLLAGRDESVNERALMYSAVALRLPATLQAIIDTFHPQDFNFNYGQSLLHLAAVSAVEECSCTEIVKILMKAAPHLIDVADVTGNTPLHEAASNGAIDFVQGIAGMHFLVDKRDGNGNTALYLAYKAGRSDICMELIELGAQEELAFNSQDPEDRFDSMKLFQQFQESDDEKEDETEEEEIKLKPEEHETVESIKTILSNLEPQKESRVLTFEVEYSVTVEKQEIPSVYKQWLSSYSTYFSSYLSTRKGPNEGDSEETEILLNK